MPSITLACYCWALTMLFSFSPPTNDLMTTPTHFPWWATQAKPIVANIMKDATQAIKHTFCSIADFFHSHDVRTLEDSTAVPPSKNPTIHNLNGLPD
jgi:hypothetical protein